MVTIEELKLGDKTLEALKFLLLQINELDVTLSELNFEELREANNQAKTQIEILNNIKTLVLNTEKSISQVKASIDSRSEEINTTKREIEDVKTNIMKAKDDTTLIYGDISSKTERMEQKYNEIGEIKKGVDRKFDDIKNIEEQSRDMANEITNNKNIILRKIDENINTLNNTISNISILKSETLQEIATTKASIDTRANEALNQANTALTDIKAIVADFRGKQTELNALKASLESLKSSLENLNKSGLINDTEAGVAQTYSSNKINSLLQGVLRERDVAEDNAGGKLVRRNAQGNIYATNIYLNATTKAEVSDIKNSLATDRWKFIVRDTNEGFLRSMSIKDFMSSQEIDAYSKAQSDSKYLTEAKGDSKYLSITDASKAYRALSDSYSKAQIDGWFVKSYSDVAATSEPNKIVKRAPNGWINVDGIRMYQYNKYMPADNIFKENEKKWAFGLFNDHDLYKVAPTTILGYLKDYFADKATTEQRLNSIPNFSYINKPNGLVRLDGRGKIDVEAIPYKESLVIKENTLNVNLTEGKNFVINAGRHFGLFDLYEVGACIGQSGIIVVKGATNIKSWQSVIKWREVPTDLKDTEVFAYFVASATEVYMGRA